MPYKKHLLPFVKNAIENKLDYTIQTVGTATKDYTDVTDAANASNGKYFIKNTFRITRIMYC